MNFLHHGALGDIIYALPTIIAFGGGDFYFGKKNQYDNLKSLMEIQPCINSVNLYDKSVKIDVNLDIYRKQDLKNNHLCKCHLDPFNKTYDLSKPWLYNIEPKRFADIVVCRTSRYHDKNEIDWSILKKYADRTLFIGTDGDNNKLQEYGVKINCLWCKDVLEVARIIKGSKLYIGNQSLCFALAEAMKQPRVLEVYYEKNNCQPNGNDGYTYLNEGLIDSYLETKNVDKEKMQIVRKNKMNIGVIIIATGRYLEILSDPRFDLVNSIRKYFLAEDDVTIYVITDGTPPDGCVHIHQSQDPWPYTTLQKFRSIYINKEFFDHNDYLFYIDSDSRVVAPIGHEILSNFTVVKHFSHNRYIRRNKIPFEKREESTAFIEDKNYNKYYSAAFFGGKMQKIIDMAGEITHNVNIDLKNDLIAVWHDESHFNKYIYGHNPDTVLENKYQWRINSENELTDSHFKEKGLSIVAVNLIDKSKYREHK